MHSTEDEAHRLDQADPGHRDLFRIPPIEEPPADGGRYSEVAYLAGNSLGLQPKATRYELLEDLDSWAQLGVEGHLEAARPWLPYHELLTEPAARLVGARAVETVIMNSLTVNLHLLMVSFYRPDQHRYRIVIEDSAFPSDSYAVRSQARFHGFDPDQAVVRLRPRPGEDVLRTEDVCDFLATEGETIALVLLGGVNFLTGELMDIATITEAGQQAGATVGWDLAHAAGNVPLHLHDWGVDFAAWCSYKYLNSGPGALAGVFIHERHLGRDDLPRFEGWWSTEAATRFKMAPVSRPPATAEAWQISNPPIFSMSPVRTSLELFDKVGIQALRERSIRLTGYLERLLDEVLPGRPLELVTPRDPQRRGCQLSVRIVGRPGSRAADSGTPAGSPGPSRALTDHGGQAGELARRLRHEHGVIADAREPDIVRFAPVPLYSTYHDCWRAAAALAAAVPMEEA